MFLAPHRPKTTVLLLFLLLLLLLLLLPLQLFLNLVVAENRQIGCVFHFVKTLGAKNTVNTDVFCASEAQNHRICDVFCFW